MNYTENYQLPQWVETDRIMMEDFNEAMAKVESGITAATGKVVLSDITVQEETSQIVLDFQQVDLEQFYLLELWAPKLQATSSCNVTVRLNDIADSVYYSKTYSSISEDAISYMVSASLRERSTGIFAAGLMLTINLFDAMLCGRAEISNFYEYDGTYRGTNSKVMWGIHPNYITRETLTHLTIQSTAPLQPGCRIALLANRI